MPGRYEDLPEILEELKQRGCIVEQPLLVTAMTETGLPAPLDEEGITELKCYLEPQLIKIDVKETKLKKILNGSRWRNKVIQARSRLRIPSGGLLELEAKARHDDLLSVVFGPSPDQPEIDKDLVLKLWGDIIWEARQLCSQLDLNPTSLDGFRTAFATGAGNGLWGLRTLLDPECVFVSEGKTFTTVPTATDRLMAHLVWGLPLSAADLPTGPGGYYVWERMPDGGGRFREETFNLDRATPSELRQMRISLRERKRKIRNELLKTFHIGMTWEDRWQEWNKMFPDLAFSSPATMRKIHAYWKQRT